MKSSKKNEDEYNENDKEYEYDNDLISNYDIQDSDMTIEEEIEEYMTKDDIDFIVKEWKEELSKKRASLLLKFDKNSKEIKDFDIMAAKSLEKLTYETVNEYVHNFYLEESTDKAGRPGPTEKLLSNKKKI